jgi:hypothetical protein
MYLGAEFGGYTAHHPTAFRDVRERPLRRENLEKLLGNSTQNLSATSNDIQRRSMAASRWWGHFWGHLELGNEKCPRQPVDFGTVAEALSGRGLSRSYALR